MSYVLHQMSDITTTKQQVIKKKQFWVLAQFCKSKRYQIQKIKKEFTKPRKSRFLPHIFFLWSPSKPIKATYLKLWPSSEKIRISNSLKSGFWKKNRCRHVVYYDKLNSCFSQQKKAWVQYNLISRLYVSRIQDLKLIK